MSGIVWKNQRTADFVALGALGFSATCLVGLGWLIRSWVER